MITGGIYQAAAGGGEHQIVGAVPVGSGCEAATVHHGPMGAELVDERLREDDGPL